MDQPRSTQRYACTRALAKVQEEDRLVNRIHELVRAHPRRGYRLIWGMLRLEGWRVNRKRVHRLWKREGFRVPKKQHKKRHCGSSADGIVRRRAEHKNHVWCWDFIHDSDERGRPLKWLSLVDEFTRECLALEVARSITASDAIDVLAEVMRTRGMPEHLRSDNGPEFVAAAIKSYLACAGAGTLYVKKGSPWENGYAESFHSRLRDELLNAEEFVDVRDAGGHAARWKSEYNERRPHSSLGYVPPAIYAATCRTKGSRDAGWSCVATLAVPPVGAAPLPPARPASKESKTPTLITSGT